GGACADTGVCEMAEPPTRGYGRTSGWRRWPMRPALYFLARFRLDLPTLQRLPVARRIHSFFFQAEDGIRDYKVTGVQTCALPIYSFPVDVRLLPDARVRLHPHGGHQQRRRQDGGVARRRVDRRGRPLANGARGPGHRSEERRVGKGWRAWRGRAHGGQGSMLYDRA